MAEKTKKFEVELFQVRAQLERASSANLDEMLSIQKSAFDRTGLGYGFSSSTTASTSSTIFVSHAINVGIKNNNVKTDVASENIDNGKSILGAPLSKIRRKLKTLGIRRLTLKSLNKRSNISIIIVELSVILNQIAING